MPQPDPKSVECQPASCFRCPSHPTALLRLHPPALTSTYHCGSCGSKLSGSMLFLACPQAKTCKGLCSLCRICPKNHILKPIHALKSQSVSCSNCQAAISSAALPIFACHLCSHFVCRPCIQASDSLLTAVPNHFRNCPPKYVESEN